MIDRPKTILCDIDGVLFEHCGDITKQHLVEPKLLPGVIEQIKKWDIKGYKIILVTGRRESVRKETEVQLSKAGILYDQLVMGVTGGVRVLINDRKPNGTDDTAVSVNVIRNCGLEEVDI